MHPLDITVEKAEFDHCRIFVVDKRHCVVKDSLDASGFKIPFLMPLELDVSPKH